MCSEPWTLRWKKIKRSRWNITRTQSIYIRKNTFVLLFFTFFCYFPFSSLSLYELKCVFHHVFVIIKCLNEFYFWNNLYIYIYVLDFIRIPIFVCVYFLSFTFQQVLFILSLFTSIDCLLSPGILWKVYNVFIPIDIWLWFQLLARLFLCYALFIFINKLNYGPFRRS